MDILSKTNAELKAAKVGLTIEARGSKLSLRGVFPPKPGNSSPSTQRLKLNINATPEGIKYAKAEALRVYGLIATRQFSWSEFLDLDKPSLNTVAH